MKQEVVAWCYTSNEDKNGHTKQLCDIPVRASPACEIFWQLTVSVMVQLSLYIFKTPADRAPQAPSCLC